MQTLTEQAAAIAAGDISPTELVQRALDEIDRVQPRLNAFTHVLGEHALLRAKELESGPSAGPLHGVPIAIKELYDVEGLPTTGCCGAFAERVSTQDSAVVERLRAAGAIVVAKTNQHEMAVGPTNAISSFGPTRNPWDNECITGGSSGGSGAAVAAGVVAMATGSDTGGSVRIPASFCGVTGLKPTHGAISLRGAMPLVPSLDTAGPLAVSAADCRLVFDVLCAFDPGDPWSRPAAGQTEPVKRIGLLGSFMSGLDSETARGMNDAIEQLKGIGFDVREVDVPSPDEIWPAMGAIFMSEFAACYPDLDSDERAHSEVRSILQGGKAIPAGDYLRARDTAMHIRRRFEAALTEVDALLAPATRFPAPRLDEELVRVEGGVVDVRIGPAHLTIAANVTGLPALAFPVGFSAAGLPVGAQLIGPDWSELVLCDAVTAYQRETDWHLRRPA